MVRNIVLDMGNVLLDYDPNIPLDAFCTSHQEREVIYLELFNGPEWIQADMGLIKNAEIYDFVQSRVEAKFRKTLKKCCSEWDICMKPIPGAKEFCEFVREQGFSVYVLSNASERFYHYFERLLPVSFFDGVLISSEIHIIKPDRKCYETFLNRFRLSAEECLFIDDREANVRGAQEAGMKAVIFQNNYEELKKLVKSFRELI